MSTKVYLGKSEIAAFYAHHWAVKVGSRWYEIEGAGKKGNGKPNKITVSHGWRRSAGGAEQFCCVGKTYKDDEDISNFNDQWLAKHPKYNYLWNNCQKYAQELVVFCCGENIAWPKEMRMESSAPTWSFSCPSYALKDDNIAKAGIGSFDLTGNCGPFGGRLGGPKAAGHVGMSKDGPGAFVDAEACRVEANVGFVKAAFSPNVSTGAGFRDGNVEASVLGTGFSLGDDGLKVKTPLFEVGCSVM